MADPILCPDCDHDIDRHELDEPCWECFYEWDVSDEPHFCRLRPSDIARAFRAEPSEHVRRVGCGHPDHRSYLCPSYQEWCGECGEEWPCAAVQGLEQIDYYSEGPTFSDEDMARPFPSGGEL